MAKMGTVARIQWQHVPTAMIILSVVVTASASAEQWPGWRGLTLDGKAQSPNVPISWSRAQNVRWKTPIPGSGHSSPVVSEDSVYVTTAYATQEGSAFRQAMQYLLFFLSLGVALAAIPFVVSSSIPRNEGLKSISRLSSAATIILALFISIALIHFGEHLFDFHTCTIRGWIGSSFICSLCLFLAGYRLPSQTIRAIIGAAAILFAVFVWICFPAMDHVFRGGVLASNTQIAVTAGVLPFIIGAFLISSTVTARGNYAQDFRPLLGMGNRRYSFGLTVSFFAVPVILALGTAYLVLQMLTDSTAPSGDKYSPTLPWWTLPVTGISLGLCLAIRMISRSAVTRAALFVNFAFITTAIFFLLVLGLTLIETLVENSSYLTYHLGSPRLVPGLGWPLFGIFSATCALGTIICLITIRLPAAQVPAGVSIVFRISVLLLAIGTFTHINYLVPSEIVVRALVCLDRHNGMKKWSREGLPRDRRTFGQA